MEVHRNLRTPKAAPGKRMIRIVGDGTPGGTRLLDGKGEQIPEMVTGYSIQGDTDGCARGIFIYLEMDENGYAITNDESGGLVESTFEPRVMYEPAAELSESRESQLDRLAGFIIKHVPSEPSQDEGAVDTAIRLLSRLVEVPRDG